MNTYYDDVEMGMDTLLMPELRRLHMKLREEEKDIPKEERKNKHEIFIDYIKEIIRLSEISRKEGLLSFEEIGKEMKKDPQKEFESQQILMIADGGYPERIRSVMMMKYFSTEQGTDEAIIHIMGIYGLECIQAGCSPSFILELLKNMVPSDVRNNIDERYFLSAKELREWNICLDDYCKGGFRIKSGDAGFLEANLCHEVVLSMSNRSLQRILRDIENATLSYAMKAFSGDCRKHVFNNMSANRARYIASNLREDDPEDKETYYLRGEWELDLIRRSVIVILKLVDRLSVTGEIELSMSPAALSLSAIMPFIIENEKSRGTRKEEWDKLLEVINGFKRFDIGLM